MPARDAEFDPYAWHDCAIWRLEVRADTSATHPVDALVLHLDFIVEWGSGDADARFVVAPATLAFHGVTDMHVSVDWGASGFQVAVHDMVIDRIERQLVADQKVYLDRPYYAWAIHLSWPALGRLTFGAFAYTQTLLAKPIPTAQQTLSWEQRSAG